MQREQWREWGPERASRLPWVTKPGSLQVAGVKPCLQNIPEHSRTFMFLLEEGFPTLTLLAFGPDDSLLSGATLCYRGSLAASLTSANTML